MPNYYEECFIHNIISAHPNSAILFLPPGTQFSRLIQDHYQQLIDHVLIPDFPSPIQATHHTPLYKNVFIPPIGCQRLISLDDRLLIVGPRSARYSTDWDCSQKVSGTTLDDMGTVIGVYDTGHAYYESSSYISVESDLPNHHLGGSIIREKWEAGMPNLGDIREEGESSLPDASLYTDLNSSVGKSMENNSHVHYGIDFTRRGSLKAENTLHLQETDSNNNADNGLNENDSQRKSQTASDQNNDIISQIFSAATDSPQATARPRRSSVASALQRPSTFAAYRSTGVESRTHMQKTVPSSASRIAMNFRSDNRFHSVNLNRPNKIASRSNMPRSVVSNHQLKGSPDIGNSRPRTPPMEKAVYSSTVDVKDKAVKDSTDVNAEIVKKASTVTEECVFPQNDSLKNLKSSRTKVNQSTCDLDSETNYTDLSKESSQLSRNDSEESAELRKFQAVMKQDFHVPGQGHMDKNIIHPIHPHRRISVLEESEQHLNTASDINEVSNGSHEAAHFHKPSLSPKSHSEKSGDQDVVLAHKPSSLTLTTHVHDKAAIAKSRESLVVLSGGSKKAPSQSVDTDTSSFNQKRKGTIDASVNRKSVMSLDSRSRDTNDNRITVADKLEKKRSTYKKVSATLPAPAIDYDHISMTVSVADGISGPFKHRPSQVDNFSKLRRSLADSKGADRFLSPRKASSQRYVGRKSARLEDSTHNLATYHLFSHAPVISKGVQHTVKMHDASVQANHSIFRSSISPIPNTERSLSFSQPLADYRMFQIQVPDESKTSLTQPQKSSSMDDQHLLSSKTLSDSSARSSIDPNVNPSLLPLISPVSGTVLSNLSKVTEERNRLKANNSSVIFSEYSAKGDSDIESLLYEDDLLEWDENGGKRLSKRRKHAKLVEVRTLNINTQEYETYVWRYRTLQICKLTPVTGCSALDDCRLKMSAFLSNHCAVC